MTWWWLWSVSSLGHWVLWITPANRERRKHVLQHVNFGIVNLQAAVACYVTLGMKFTPARKTEEKNVSVRRCQCINWKVAGMLLLRVWDCFWYMSKCSRVMLLSCCHFVF